MLYFLSVCAFVALCVVNAEVYFEEKFLDGRCWNCYIIHLYMTCSRCLDMAVDVYKNFMIFYFVTFTR